MSGAETRRLVDKLWNYCNVLRDDGVSTIDYVEQLTFLLFLKMAHERETRILGAERILPSEPAWQGRGWQELLDNDGQKLEVIYRELLEDLGRQGGTLGVIFRKAQNRVQDPAKLKRLVKDLIGQENWSRQGTDVKGDAYEELLARSAEDIKSGAGQYFTPRALIHAMVNCVRPTPDDTVIDPACGTGGFLMVAAEHIYAEHGDSLTPEQRRHLNTGGLHGTELVDGTARLAEMNLLLHGIGSYDGEPLIEVADALARPPAKRATVVLANPPFGRKSSITVFGADGRVGREDIAYERQDFWVTTTNKQLNFVQHIAKMLQIDGRAAVVVPDNVLFEGGAGETVRRTLLAEYDVHTMLRLPTGTLVASRPTCCFSTAAGPRITITGPTSSGSTTCASASTSLSSRTPCAANTSRTSSIATCPASRAASVSSPNGLRRSATTSWSPETRPTSISPGSRTPPSTTPTPCCPPRSSPPRSSRTFKRL